MCKLRFDYFNDSYQAGEVKPINISEDAKSGFEERANETWASICDDLNKTGGYIKVTTSADGLYIEIASLVAVDWLNDFCIANNLPNRIKVHTIPFFPPDL
jgi:hypothetical protein